MLPKIFPKANVLKEMIQIKVCKFTENYKKWFLEQISFKKNKSKSIQSH